MASKRAVRRRMCEGKVAHADRDAALVAVRKLYRTTLQTRAVTPYRCRFCGGWHIGHASYNPNYAGRS